jgi:hypothetical protein
MATVWTCTLVLSPLRDLGAGEYLLNAAGDLLRFRQAQPQGFRAELPMDVEAMQMIVLPAHEPLDHVM